MAAEISESTGVLLDDSATPPPVKVKKKLKGAIPIGRNGLPKRSVVKTRKTKNAKGYTGTVHPQRWFEFVLIAPVTEDYLIYESVSESEGPVSLAQVQKNTMEISDLKTKAGNSLRQSVSKSASVQARDGGKDKSNVGNSKKDLNSYFRKK